MIRPADLIPPPEGRGLVVSFFDYTGHAVRDWAQAGWWCWCLDIQHETQARIEDAGDAGGAIVYARADLAAGSDDWAAIRAGMERAPIGMAFSFPPCTDLTVAGARHFAAKAAADPQFQAKAVQMARGVERLMAGIAAPWIAENPVSRLATLWRRPDHYFDPCDFGGYLPPDDSHPRFPRYIAPRDAYTKKTGIWAGGGFVMPPRRPVRPEVLERRTKSGRLLRGSRQFMLLGGASARTKNIRNETPRGFARAVFEANAPARGPALRAGPAGRGR
ncbi:hypothetical protein [Oceanicella actignis]|uniref:Dcm methylase n=1 Tax=Oceanicella actignis TaxID=1189325 RepID=A0A1M7U1X0_9RHOB|nr:hypothetical protein [Oceanicella actignis]SES76185.1 hypothetical protein SAMN04488119_101385 [Oceanicella actignis]SHN77031.1 hypothetical protein SAMN05216200_11437 [Oceanicella actignis]